MGFNEDFIEVLVLVYDIGYFFYGYVGEDVLDECFWDEGGFLYN